MNVLICGGSGYVGRKLTTLLHSKGFTVTWLSRKAKPGNPVSEYEWDYKQGTIDKDCFNKTDILINLAGASINGKRWTKTYKQELYDSRVEGSKFLYECVNNMPNNINTVIQASAVGIYGIDNSTIAAEETEQAATDFLAITCKDWEQTLSTIKSEAIRKCIVRIAPVMDKESEAFKAMANLAKKGLASPLGNGNQPFPWVHTEDLIHIFLKLMLEESLSGAFNAAAPEKITNASFTKKLAHAYGKKMWLPNVPAFVLRLALGEIANYLINGRYISSKKIMDAGFEFQYANVDSLMQSISSS